jgi:transcriptional regulator with XRE-family HTH domain
MHPMQDDKFSNQLQRFGAAIRSLRQGKGMSQEAFADHCCLDRTYVGGVERGERNLSFVKLIEGDEQ